MAYLGKTPSQAVRQRYYFTASGGETSLSGADDNGNTLTFTDGAYVDVYLNGLLLVAGTDYNTSTVNTIGGLTALSASDVVELVVYDTFAVFGGEVQGDFTVTNGDLIVDDGDFSIGQNLKFNSGYGSAATAYGCRAWVNFDGTGTVAIRASGNVSSITDLGTGQYQVNFTTAMPDANYAIVFSGYGNSARNTTTTNIASSSAAYLFVYTDSTSTFIDAGSSYAAVFR